MQEIETAKNEIKQGDTIIELFDRMYDVEEERTLVESILKAKKRTKEIINHINSCVAFYRFKAQESGNEEFERRVEVMERLYLDAVPQTFEQIAEDLFISSKTVNRDRKKAIQELAPLFFGVDGINMS